MPRRKTGEARKIRRYDDLEILDFIDRHKRATKRSPSESQIATTLQLSGRAVAHNIVHRLIKRGMLTSSVPSPGWPADLKVTQSGHSALIPWRIQREQSATESAAPSATPAGGAAHVARGGAA